MGDRCATMGGALPDPGDTLPRCVITSRWWPGRRPTRSFGGVLKLSRVHWKPYGGAVIYQLQRASLSVQLNIAEGYAYGNSATYTKFLGIAYGSAVETLELLDLAAGAGLFPVAPSEDLIHHARSSRNLL